MARKSNKTAHVLNLLAGNDAKKEEPKEEAVSTSSDLPSTPSHTPVNPDAAAIPAAPESPEKPAVSAPSAAVVDDDKPDPVAELIHSRLLDELNDELNKEMPDNDFSTDDLSIHFDHEEDDASEETPAEPEAVVKEKKAVVETVTSEKTDTTEETAAVEAPETSVETVTAAETVIAEEPEAAAEVSAEKAEPAPETASVEKADTASETEAAAETQTAAEPEAAVTEEPAAEPEPDFIRLNVIERIVEEKIIYFMRQFDVCTCDRCVADTIALTLNGLTPKYIVTEPYAVEPLMSFYTNKYIPDITVEATKACITIKENPRH